MDGGLPEAPIVHAGIFDARGTFRSKRFPREVAAGLVADGWSFIDAIQWWDTADGVFDDRPSYHAPAELDRTTARPFPFEPASVVIGDFTGPMGALSPRRALQRAVDDLAAVGVHARLAWELEVIVLAGDDIGAAAPVAIAPHNRCWSSLTPATDVELLAGWTEMLAAGGVAVDHVCSELGPGCFELALAPRDPITSADDAAFAKLWTKAMAKRMGLTASFMAQLSNDFPGLGGHPVVSLHDATTGVNLLTDAIGRGEDGHGLSATGEHAVAGILRALPDVFAAYAPTVNSYRRYAPGNWAPRTATWGLGNYTCGLRAVLDRPASARLELRLPGADVAPHLAAAALLASIADGIRDELPVPAPITGNARDVVDPAIGPLPRTLLEAAERLGGSKRARALLGDELVEHQSAALLAEDGVCRREVGEFERRRYLDHV